jgi:hypothetical protein
MQAIRLLLEEGDFDGIVHHAKALSDGGDLTIAVKENGTLEGRPVVVLSFTVEVPKTTKKKILVCSDRDDLACIDRRGRCFES